MGHLLINHTTLEKRIRQGGVSTLDAHRAWEVSLTSDVLEFVLCLKAAVARSQLFQKNNHFSAPHMT